MIDKRLISKINKQLIQCNIKKKPIKKCAEDEQTFFQLIYIDDPKALDKILNTANHQKNIDLNYNAISPQHLSDWLSSKEHK